MKEINNHFIKVEQYCQKFIFFFNFCAVLQTGIKKKIARSIKYEECPEIKNTSREGRSGNFLCLLWQNSCRA